MTTLSGDVYFGQYGTTHVWNGLDWNALEISGPVYAVNTFSNSVYFGGYIRSTGGKASYGLAAWQPAAARPELIARATSEGVLVAWPSALTNYVVESARDFDRWSNAIITPVVIGSHSIITNRASEADRRFFRLRRQSL